MKTQFKSLHATAAFGLWACAANAHHAAGQIVCTDVSPARPLSGIVVTVQGALGGTFTATTDFDGAYGINLPVLFRGSLFVFATRSSRPRRPF